MIHNKHQRVGVFIDVQNMYYSARNLFNRKVNFGNIVKKSVGNRQLIRAIAYVVSTKTGENQPFFDALWNLGIEAKEKQLMEYHGGQKKADWDVGITIDAIENAENLDVIILVSGDGDYVPLVRHLKHKGKIVEVAAFRETTATRLVEAVGKENFINLSDHKRSFLISERRTRSSANENKTEKPAENKKTDKKTEEKKPAKTSAKKKSSPKKTTTTKKKTTSSSRRPAARKNSRKPNRKRTVIRRAGVPREKKDPIKEEELSANERALNP